MVTAMAFCASPPGAVCPTPHAACQTTSASYVDFVDTRNSSGVTKPMIGGLSWLFSSPSTRQDGYDSSLPSTVCSAVGKRGNYYCGDLIEDASYSLSRSSPLKLKELSPVSVFQGPGSGASSLPKRIGSSYSGRTDSGSRSSLRDRVFVAFASSSLGMSYCEPVSIADDLTVVEEERREVAVTENEELPFNLEGTFMETVDVDEAYAVEILRDAQKRHGIFHEEIVVKAFQEAEKAHRGQMRASGVPYLTHCVETAILLASIGSDETLVVAGLLHDALDDTDMEPNHLQLLFGESVVELVEGVSKLSQFSKLARESDTAFNVVEADRLHTMYLAMLDVRVVLIKLADRLHNMSTLQALPLYKQQRFAKETLEIFVPLANRLGISSWNVELENLCFKYLYPQEYRDLSSKLTKDSRETVIMSAVKKLDEALRKANIGYSMLSGRAKSLYSVHRKMMKKKLDFDEIHDILGLRLIVSRKEDCYAALQIVHDLWPGLPGKLKDYIVKPKFNGYQSLHTVVRSEDKLLFEVQIRTTEMHEQAEYGLAAHWRYKEGKCSYSSYILQRVKWARWLLTWYNEAMGIKFGVAQDDAIFRPPCPFPSHREDCPHYDKLGGPLPSATEEPIFLIIIENERMTVQELTPNSTVKDLLDKMSHTVLGLTTYDGQLNELKPRVNAEAVSDLYYKLKTGDVVEFNPSISDKSLTKYREKIKRMFDGLNNQPSTLSENSSEIEAMPSLVHCCKESSINSSSILLSSDKM